MKHPFGPWTTALSNDTDLRLSAFWTRRLARLKPLERPAVISWRHALGLLSLALAVGLLPTLHGDRTATAQPPASPAPDPPTAAPPTASADPVAPAPPDSAVDGIPTSLRKSDTSAAEPTQSSGECKIYLLKSDETKDSLSFWVETFVDDPGRFFQAMADLAERDSGVKITLTRQVHAAGNPFDALAETERTDDRVGYAKYLFGGSISRETLDENLKRLQRLSGADTLTIYADAEIASDKLVELIGLAQSAGFTKFRFTRPEPRPPVPYSATYESRPAQTYERSTTPTRERAR